MRRRVGLYRARLQRHGRQILGIAVAFAVTVTAAWQLDLFDIRTFELGEYDRALRAFTRRDTRSKDVVVLAVDDSTLQTIQSDPGLRNLLGGWPYDRRLWRDILGHLDREGARAVVFDLVMDTANLGPGDELMREAVGTLRLPVYLGFAVHPQPAEARLPAVTAKNLLPGEPIPPPPGAEENPDEAGLILAADEMDAGEDPFAIEPASGSTGADAPDPALRAWIAERLVFPVKADVPLPVLTPERRASDGAVLPRVPIPPIRPLLEVLDGVGLVDPEADPDGVLRRTRFAYRDGANTFVTLPVAAVADLLGAREVVLGDGWLRMGDRRWRVNPDGSAKIDFGGTLNERFPVIPLITALADSTGSERRLPPDTFRDKVVVVGGIALATQDTKPTPFAPISPGVIKQAATVDALLGGRFIVDAPLWATLLVTFGVALLSAAIVTAARSAFVDALWPAALFLGFFTVTGAGLALFAVHLPATVPIWAGVGASITATAMTRLFADRQGELLQKGFALYVDPHIVERMLATGQPPKLEGENREITAFFSDIRGFSTFSEGMKEDPTKLVRLLNTYLTRVSAALLEEDGYLDKYIGDAVVALFGAPVRNPNHAVSACRAALAARAEVDKLRAVFRAQGLPDVYTRIGLNSGVMFVGNFGSEQLFDYTAMGDDMNLAARLEGANKAYGTTIMIGEKTYALAKDHIEVRELDRVRVAGKKEPVTVYELLALKGGLSAAQREVVALYEEALAHYRARRFDEALLVLRTLLTKAPDDGPALTLKARCETYRVAVPEDFDGVANLEK